MAYTLQAFIGEETMLRANCPTHASVVPLPQGKAMLPLCDKLLEEYDIPFLPLTDEGRSQVEEVLADFIAPLIGRGRFVYVEAEFFGGDGTQACVTWEADGKASRPAVAPEAINKALGALGVQIGDHHDEFDALGLGRHRSTEDWLTELASKQD